MTESTDIEYTSTQAPNQLPPQSHVADDGFTQVVTERHVRTQVDEPSRVPAFIGGFLTAAVLAAIGFVTFLAVSDSDDDGNLQIDVPAVDVQIDE